jgi:hypothetical protein
MEKLAKLDIKSRIIKNRFFNQKRPPKLMMVDKLEKINKLILSYTDKTSRLQSRKNFIKTPLINPSRLRHKTKSCDFFKVKLPAIRFDLSKVKRNLRYLSKDLDDEDNKNCIITPEDSWKSCKRLYQETNPSSNSNLKPSIKPDSNRTQETSSIPQSQEGFLNNP